MFWRKSPKVYVNYAFVPDTVQTIALNEIINNKEQNKFYGNSVAVP